MNSKIVIVVVLIYCVMGTEVAEKKVTEKVDDKVIEKKEEEVANKEKEAEEEFVKKIESGTSVYSENYYIKHDQSGKTPVSKPNKSKKDNLE